MGLLLSHFLIKHLYLSGIYGQLLIERGRQNDVCLLVENYAKMYNRLDLYLFLV